MVTSMFNGRPRIFGKPGERRVLLDDPANVIAVVDTLRERHAQGELLHLYASLQGPWSRIETRWLDDATLSPGQLAARVQPWLDLPPVGGTAMDAAGDLYFSDLAADALRRVTPEGRIETVLSDPRLHWVDAPVFDAQGRLYLPVPQMDRVGLFQGGRARVTWPVRIYRLDRP